MKDFLAKYRPNFEKGGKYEKLMPLFGTIDTFLYVPDHTTKSGSHVRDAIDLKRTMIVVVIALVPALLFGIWNAGHQHYVFSGEYLDMAEGFWPKVWYGIQKIVPLIVVSYAFGLGTEFVFATRKGHALHEGYLVSGMLIPLCVPIDIPLWMLALSAIFAVVIGKEIFGGTGMNIINIALTARAFLFFAYPTKMSGDKVWVGDLPDGVSGATALGELALTVPLDKTSPEVTSVVDKFGAAGDFSMMNSFIGNIPGSVGETSALAILIGAAILMFTGIGSWRIIISSFIGGLLMGFIFNLVGANAYMDLPPVHQLLLGGFLFGVVFMATDPVTGARTNTGQWIYGFFAGFFSILVRVFNPAYPEGVMMAILFMNIMAPLIDHYVVEANIKKRLKRIKVASA
ncbi:MAG TPA: NADH:ubiquinone reductase (Na(+)-transporting) subunit B [Flavobacteriales bacterium]|jgi:Na+-transporting NADH:ubiquinone oxidoreductase subunit B|nr:NADH:ubiquinone reductase (Na(+)-transporting) subunit B [Flavobacteriales bacterium]